MRPRDLLTLLAAGRIALGAGLIVKPDLVTGIWLGRDGRRPAIGALSRGFGARDAALGAGTLGAMRSGGSLRPWILAGIAADATDLVAVYAARDSLPSYAVPMIYALVGGALVAGVVNLAAMEDSPSA